MIRTINSAVAFCAVFGTTIKREVSYLWVPLALLILAAAILAPRSAEAKPVIAITTIAAPVRASATTDGKVIKTIPAGTALVVTAVQGTWGHVMWMEGQKPQEGWMLISQLRIPPGGNGHSTTFTSPGGAEFELNVTNTDLNCREGMEGYASCAVTVTVEYDSNYNGNDEPNVDVQCEVELRTTDSEEYSRTLSDTARESYYGSSSGGQMEVDFTTTSVDPVVRAKLTDVNCEIESVD